MWISSFYTPLSWNYHGDWYIWQYLNRGTLEGYSGGEKYIDLNEYLNRGTLEGYSGGEKYIDLNVLNKEKDLHDLMIQ